MIKKSIILEYFSVVIPLYNKEKHIQRAIRSVLAQTHQDFELIIVDDGSTDASFEMANAIKDPRIRIIHQENQGVSGARNRGVAEAQYDWVAFLDADDEWLPEFLESIIDLYDKFPHCGVLATFYSSRYLNGNADLNTYYPSMWKGQIDNYFRDLLYCWPFNASCVAIKKSILEQVGGFPEGIVSGEDTNTWIRLAVITKFAYFNRPLAIYHKETKTKLEQLNNVYYHDNYNHADYLRHLLLSDPRSFKYRTEICELAAKFEYPYIRYCIDEGNRKEAIQRLLLLQDVRFLRLKWWILFIRAILSRLTFKKTAIPR